MTLSPVLKIIERISDDPSRLAKEKIIKTSLNSIYGDIFRKVVIYAIDPLLKFNLTNIDFIASTDVDYPSIDNIFNFLDYLNTKKGATDSERLFLSKISSIDKDTNELINRIIDKDLQCGASIKTFKKFIPEINNHACMLCEDDIDKFLKTAKSYKNIAWSVKLDGVRTWCLYRKLNSNINYLSRNGKPFDNFHVFDENIDIIGKYLCDLLNIDMVIFDGEVIASGFQKLMTQIKRLKEMDPSIFYYHIFDIVLPDKTLYERYDILVDSFSKNSFVSNININYLKHYFGEFKEKSQIYDKLECLTNDGYEGLVLKTADGPYEFKRSKHWTKLKKFYTIDLPVIDITEGDKKYSGTLGALVVDFNGVKVNVGSGLTDFDRDYFYSNPPIGKLIEISYQEVTKDKSLRFPTYIRLREDK